MDRISKDYQVLKFPWLWQENLKILAQYSLHCLLLFFEVPDMSFNLLEFRGHIFAWRAASAGLQFLDLDEFRFKLPELSAKLCDLLLPQLDKFWDICDAYNE